MKINLTSKENNKISQSSESYQVSSNLSKSFYLSTAISTHNSTYHSLKTLSSIQWFEIILLCLMFLEHFFIFLLTFWRKKTKKNLLDNNKQENRSHSEKKIASPLFLAFKNVQIQYELSFFQQNHYFTIVFIEIGYALIHLRIFLFRLSI